MHLRTPLLLLLGAVAAPGLRAQIAPGGSALTAARPASSESVPAPPAAASVAGGAVSATSVERPTWTAVLPDGSAGQRKAFSAGALLNNDRTGRYGDLVVGLSGGTSAMARNRVLVYFGDAQTFETVPQLTIPAPDGAYGFGHSVATGDVNGDGYGDLLVGSPGDTNAPSTYGGRIDLFVGGPSGLNAAPAWTVTSDQAGARWGWAVSVGSANGDGYADIAASAPYYDRAASNDGLVTVYHGGAGLPDTTPDFSLWGGESNDLHLGLTLAFTHDLDGDGYGDLAMGSPDYVVNSTTSGILAVATGSATGFLSTRFRSLTQTGVQGFGASLADAPAYGDATNPRNGVAVGSRSGSDGDVRVFRLAAGGTTFGRLDFGGYGQTFGQGTGLGTSVVAADLDGDGATEVIAGLPEMTGEAVSQGGFVSGLPGETGGYEVVHLGTTGDSYGTSLGVAYSPRGQAEVLVVAGSTASDSLRGVYYAVTPPAGAVEAQLVQNSAGLAQLVGPIDVYVDGVLKASGLRLGQASPFVPLVGGTTVNVTFTPAGQAPSAGRTIAVPVPPSGRYTVSLMGTPEQLLALYSNPYNRDLALRLVVVTRLPPATQAGKNASATARLYVFHAVTDAPPLRVVLAGGDTLAQRLDYGEGMFPAVLAPGDYTLELSNALTGAALRTYRVTIPANADEVNLSLVGFLDPAANGNGPAMTAVAVTPSGSLVTTGTERPEAGGSGLELSAPAPNPARGTAVVTFTLPEAGPATLAVYDLLGRRVAMAFDGAAAAGTHPATVDASALAPGVYVLRLSRGDAVRTQRLVVTR